MTWADATYAIWAAGALGAGVLWLVSVRGWTIGRARVGRAGELVAGALAHRWVRPVAVLGWIWVGVHVFAR